MHLFVNLTLSLILSVILTLPVVAGHFVIAQPSAQGTVAGATSISEREINIIPNLQDFDGHVSFSPGLIRNGRYQDTLGLRVFQRQKASYHGLYTLYNLTADRPLVVEIATTGIPEEVETAFGQVVVSLNATTQATEFLLQDVDRGATVLKLAHPDVFREGERILVGDELTTVVVVSADGVVVTPLLSDHPRNEPIYFESIVVTPGRLINPRTRTVTLQPSEKAIVSAVVEGSADLVAGDEMVSLPLIFNIR